MAPSIQFHFYIGDVKWFVSKLATAKTILANDHRHKHSTYELHYMIQGDCSFLVRDQFVEMKQHDILLIAPNVYHSVKNFSSDFYKLCFYFDFSPSNPKDTISAQAIIDIFKSSETFLLNAHSQEDLLSSIVKLHDKTLSYFEVEELKSYLTLLFIWIAQNLTKKRSIPLHESDVTVDRNAIIHFFTTNYHLSNGAEILARQLHVSRRQMERIIKKQFRKNYREMLFEVRLEIATDLLKTTNHTVEEIANIVGYNNSAGFISFIKNMTGMTPLQYRKKVRSDSFRV